MQSPNTTGNAIRSVIAIILSVVGIAGSVNLKTVGVISELTLVILVSLSVLVGLFIAFVDRIKSLNLKSLTITLREMKETESSIKQIARAILNVIESKSHGLMLESYDDKKANEAIEKLKKLIA